MRQEGTREQVISVLKKKGFKEAEESNKKVSIWSIDNGRIVFRISPAGHTEVFSDGSTVAQFRQYLWDVFVYDNQITLMVGADADIDYLNVYIPRKTL